MDERAFELAVCAAVERAGYVVGRQLGAGRRRVVDVLGVEPGPAFDARARLTDATVPSQLLEADVGPGRARFWKAAFDCHPETAAEAIEAGVEAGVLERERRGGRLYVRTVDRYPEDWFDDLVAVENKPDLGRPGDLQVQLRKDVSLAVADRVVLATASRVTGAHLNRIPEAVGVWRLDPATGDREVIREPRRLPTDRPGIEIRDTTPAEWSIRPVDRDDKRRLRRRMAERAYGKGWRESFPDCTRIRADYPHTHADTDPSTDEAAVDATSRALPYCAWKDRVVSPAVECGPDCPGHDSTGDDASAVDPELPAARDAESPWRRDPPTGPRRQTGLDRFG